MAKTKQNKRKSVAQKPDQRPPVKKHDIKMLDLAFAMDCTGSMGSYITSARDNIRQIVEKIVACDHPPQDSTYVTQVHDFTPSPKTMKDWLAATSANGGGDAPEAVADALHDVLKLSWREEATKICVCISDAPPHGLGCGSDGFPNGCPAGIDPMVVVNDMPEKGITLYMVGCEPSITPYKDFFMAIAYITGGQYVPLTKAQILSQVIIGGAPEEMALEQLMDEVNDEVQADLAAGREIDPEEMSRRVHSKMASKGIRSKRLRRNKTDLECASKCAAVKKLSKLSSMKEIRATFKIKLGASGMFGPATSSRIGSVPDTLRGTKRGRGVVKKCAARRPLLKAKTRGKSNTIVTDSYDVEEDSPISYAQASRMVQKSLARNKVSKR